MAAFLAATEGVFLTAASMTGPMASGGQTNGTASEPYFLLVSFHGIYRDLNGRLVGLLFDAPPDLRH